MLRPGQSAEGSAFANDPPMVPRLRTWGRRSAWPPRGRSAAPAAADQIAAAPHAWVSAPILIELPIVMPRSSSMPRMSISRAGETNRNLSAGNERMAPGNDLGAVRIVLQPADLRRSIDKGLTWLADLRTITNATNPASGGPDRPPAPDRSDGSERVQRSDAEPEFSSKQGSFDLRRTLFLK